MLFRSGLFIITAGTAPSNFRLVLDLVESEIARLQQDGPSEAELTRAKVQVKVALSMLTESTSFRMQHLALSEICWGRVVPFAETLAGVQEVTAEDVHRLSREAFSDGHRALIAVGPLESEGGAT